MSIFSNLSFIVSPRSSIDFFQDTPRSFAHLYVTYTFAVVFVDGNFDDEFVLNGTTGQLTVNKDLKGGSEYQLIIQATDFYIPPSPAFTLVSKWSPVL